MLRFLYSRFPVF